MKESVGYLVKHGTGDQSPHGRRGTGGGGKEKPEGTYAGASDGKMNAKERKSYADNVAHALGGKAASRSNDNTTTHIETDNHIVWVRDKLVNDNGFKPVGLISGRDSGFTFATLQKKNWVATLEQVNKKCRIKLKYDEYRA